MKAGYDYTINYVKKIDTSRGTRTKFSIGEKKKDGKWSNFTCYADGNLPLQDGDKVKILQIETVDYSEYVNKKGEKAFDVSINVLVTAVNQSEKVEEVTSPFDL